MSKIQNRLKGLQPYLIQLRFPEGNPVVDMVFKNGWHVPQSELIQSTKGDSEDLNYHMFYTSSEDLGLDEILDYIEKVITLNIEREKKHALLKVKVKELQEVFRKNPLSKLEKMRFVLGGQQLIQDMGPDPMDVVDFDITDTIEKPQVKPQPEPQPVVDEVDKNENVRRAPNGEIIPPLSEEDDGEIKDEFQKFDLTSEDTDTRFVKGQNIDLPPKKNEGNKRSVELLEIDTPTNITCKCGPDDICPVCEEEKIGTY